jgi:hypothetical protein
MLTVSTKEYRDRTKSYSDKAAARVATPTQRRRNTSYRIVPVVQEDTLMSKEDYFAKFDRSLLDIQEGRGKKMTLQQVNELLGI